MKVQKITNLKGRTIKVGDNWYRFDIGLEATVDREEDPKEAHRKLDRLLDELLENEERKYVER